MLCLFATRWKTLFIAWEYQLKRASLIACFNLWGRCRKVVQAWNMQNTIVHRCGSSAGPPCAATVFQRKTSIWQLIVVICCWTCSLRDLNSAWFSKDRSLRSQYWQQPRSPPKSLWCSGSTATLALCLAESRQCSPHRGMTRGPLAITLKDDIHSTVSESKKSFAFGFCVRRIETVTTDTT